MILRTLRASLVVALAGAMLTALPVRADDYTDIWWVGKTEDGWGVNMIQSQDVIFATFFVYGPSPSTTPAWYVVTLNRQSNGSWTGDLYQTTGTGIGAAWNPSDYTATKVGTATFTPTSMTTGTLVYNVNAVSETKAIVRQTLTSIVLGGNYVGGQTGAYSGGSCSSAGGYIDTYALVVTQTGGTSASFTFAFANGISCTFSGTLVQSGQLYSVSSASYVCTTGLSTTATMSEIKATSLGLEGRFTSSNVGGGCQEDANFSAVLR